MYVGIISDGCNPQFGTFILLHYKSNALSAFWMSIVLRLLKTLFLKRNTDRLKGVLLKFNI